MTAAKRGWARLGRVCALVALPLLVASIGAEHPDVADARFTLARVLWDTKPREGQDRRRARALAQQALEHTDPGPERGALVRWLDTHSP